MSVRSPQAGQQKKDMFSMRPRTGTFTFSNIRTPRRASISATSCGVETMTAPASGTRWDMVSCASPVPGGMSTIMQSNSPHSTWPIICSSAPITIGPRQIIAVSCSTRKPMDMAFSPQREIGMIRWPTARGFSCVPSIWGREGP
jgi:hypothetical protein